MVGYGQGKKCGVDRTPAWLVVSTSVDHKLKLDLIGRVGQWPGVRVTSSGLTTRPSDVGSVYDCMHQRA